MVRFIRKYIFAGAEKNAFAPHILLVLFIYTVLVSIYTGLFFSEDIAVIRATISVVMVITYVAFERSPLGSEALAFLAPVVIITFLTGSAIFFKGDFLLFAYASGAAMISLTYLKPKGLAAYIAVTSVAHASILLIFGINLLGPAFTTVYNYLYYTVSVALNILVYIFCKSYEQTLSALTEAKNDANQAALAKGAFLSNMSHEIRTPMNAIIGMTAIGKASNDIDDAHYALSKIGDASAHLLGIINDVLDMSKIESGSFDLSRIEFSFIEMLQRVISVISFRVEEKKQNFTLRIDKKIPSIVIGDEQRLAQIITNLLGNAIKFTPNEGSVYLNSRLIKEDGDLCTVQIEVIDSGIGISPEQQSRLFQSFQQADTSIARKFGGTGLGLSISKNLVEMMGGTIWSESELGKGATFAFTVQLERSNSPEYAFISEETNWTGIRILAVDDNSGILGYIKSFVEGFWAQCDVVLCGMDALSLARRRTYDIYFLDWKLSDMDGLQLAKDLKAINHDRQAMVVIMLSNNEWGDIEERAKKAGVDGFLPKPLFPSAIADIINESYAAKEQKLDDSSNAAPIDFSGRCILLAEDVEINREIVMSLLEPTGLKIVCAENGAKAVRLFNDSPTKYDMIFMDVQMPEMDGYEATRNIRSHDSPTAKTIPIIAMTANVFREDIERCIKAGMNAHIGKPLDIKKVMGMLKKYLHMRPPDEQS